MKDCWFAELLIKLLFETSNLVEVEGLKISFSLLYVFEHNVEIFLLFAIFCKPILVLNFCIFVFQAWLKSPEWPCTNTTPRCRKTGLKLSFPGWWIICFLFLLMFQYWYYNLYRFFN